MNKKQVELLDNYRNAWATELWDVYGSCSARKRHALEYCKGDEAWHNGYGGRICSYNTNMFTYAFMYDTEEGTRLRYHTKANVYDFIIEE